MTHTVVHEDPFSDQIMQRIQAKDISPEEFYAYVLELLSDEINPKFVDVANGMFELNTNEIIDELAERKRDLQAQAIPRGA